jgi:6-phosphogluconolactonase
MKDGVGPIRRLAASSAVLWLLLAMTGCAGFFTPVTTTTGGGTTTMTPTNTGDFAYVANSFTSSTTAIYTLSGFTVGTGTLTSLSGFPVSLPFAPTATAINPADTLLYVGGLGVIYGFGISSNGALSVVENGSSPALANANVVSMDISPDGNWLFALDANGETIDQFQIASNGLLTSAIGASYTISTTAEVVPRSIRVSQNENSAYVAIALGTGGDELFTFNTSTGAMTYSQSVIVPTIATADQALAFDAAGATLYVARSGSDGGVVPYTIGSGGVLTVVNGAPFATGQGAASIILNKAGTDLYVGNETDGTISGFSIASGGVLTALTGSPYASSAGVDSLGIDNSGDYLMAASVDGGPDVALYSFGTAGQLVPATTASTGDPDEPAGAVAVSLLH